MKTLTDKLYVAGQISVKDLDAIAEAGIKTIINNRPDGEMLMQPKTADLAARASELNISFHDIPVAGGQVLPGQKETFAEILEQSDGPVLAFCRTGTRSTMLWALSQVHSLSTEDILETALKAGYDFRGHASMLDAVREQG